MLPTYKQVLAMALTAQSVALEINGYVSDCDGEGQAHLKLIKMRYRDPLTLATVQVALAGG